jgi:hypothetical protein
MQRELYRTLEWKPDSLESRAIQHNSDVQADAIRNSLYEVFQREYPKGMPVAKGNESRKRLILKCQYRPVEVPNSLTNE